ncbi:hypothetical protein F4803DRAFT_549896 [Xylaria telfairii]|nr:hypothetical protein F4803DRAFT_549896 [Xylaria telfairii]
MPSAISPEYFMASSPTKKRRREDTGEVQMSFSTLEAPQNRMSPINNNERLVRSSSRGSTSSFGVPRKVIALPMSKKFRFVGDHHHHHHEQLHSHYLHHNDFPPSALSQSQQSHFSHAHPEQPPAASVPPHQTRPAAARTNSSALLSPCHVCHRKPTKKSDLDSFGDCTGCGERTCFVCLRACQGWVPTSNGDRLNHIPTEAEDLSTSFTMQDADNEESVQSQAEKSTDTQKPQQKQKKGEGGGDGVGSWYGRGHHSVICSRCCVEKGSEGDVVCLGCLAGMEGT